MRGLRYSPGNYYQPGRTFPRDRLREPFFPKTVPFLTELFIPFVPPPASAGAIYGSLPWSGVALVANRVKSVVRIVSGATKKLEVLGVDLWFDGATFSALTRSPALVEIYFSAENNPGTPTSNPSFISQDQSDPLGFLATAGLDFTAEPGFRTVIIQEYVRIRRGKTWTFKKPLTVNAGKGFGIRVTSPNNVNCSGSIRIKE